MTTLQMRRTRDYRRAKTAAAVAFNGRPSDMLDLNDRMQFVGHWSISTGVFPDNHNVEHAAIWIDDMPDWARRIQNRLPKNSSRDDVVQWGEHGRAFIYREIKRIIEFAIEHGLVVERDGEWVET